MTAWSVFKRSSPYFDPSKSPFMIDYRVDDLDGLLEASRAEGVENEARRPRLRPLCLDHRSVAIANKIELWEAPEQL
jgi:hypothetical protein